MSAERPEHPPRDLAPGDDAVIGRVFRILLVVVAAVGALVLVVLWIAGRNPPPVERARGERVGAIPGPAPAAPTMPRVRFSDVTESAGIAFVHESGARGEKLLPETLGGGTAFFDFDGDGDQDLLLVNSDFWPGDRRAPRPTAALYRNDGSGGFRDVTAAAGLDRPLYGMGPAVADYDGDGDVDLFLTALGSNRMLRNDGGRFTDVTAAAGVAGGAQTWSTGAGFFDYDRDGDLDLFVCNYVRWSREIDLELNFTLNGRDRAYGPPTNYEGVHSYLYRNEGDGSFRDVSAAAGIEVVHPRNGRPMAKALALTFLDVDRDGWLDVFVSNDTVQNFLFHNRADGTFAEIGAAAGVGFDGAGNATGAMGVDAALVRNDGRLAVAVGNFANEMTSFYVSQRDPLRFADEAVGEGIGAPSRPALSFGLFFFDYDLDGRLDLLQANGHLENEINQVQASQTYRQPAQLFWNAGPQARSCYVEVPAERVGDLARPIVGRGATYADIDGDGDLDVLLTQIGGRPLLLRNDQELGHHWLRFVLAGTRSNRDAIGAWVELEAAGTTQRRQVMPTRSYLSQVELPLTFGLGRAERVDAVRVIWPDGTVQPVAVAGVDRVVRVAQTR